ncbi:MAG: hypothetical protein ACRDYW_04570 [Acidimicrobiales bacterium]
MRTLQRVGAGVLALTLVSGIAACGDDDDEDTAAFCDALVEFNGAVNEVEIDDTSSEADITEAGERLGPIFETIATNAPEAVSDQAEELNETVQSLREGDAEAFNADATFETYTEFLDGSIGSCDFEGVDVTATDYAFDAPDTVPAGTVALSLTNDSDAEEHEMIIFRRADGVDLSFEEILELGEEEAEDKIVFSGAAFAPPGETGSSLADLEAGDYAMVCFIPVGGAEDGPPHFTQGMLHEFTVE